jgi:hypothetical protein
MNDQSINHILRYLSLNHVPGSVLKIRFRRRVVKTTSQKRKIVELMDRVYNSRMRSIKYECMVRFNGY